MLYQGKVIRSLLSADGTLTALVGTRIRQNRLTQTDTWPAITYHVISGHDYATKSGSNDSDAQRWQINIYAETDSEADTVSERVRTLLDGIRNQTVATIEVEGIKYLTHIAMFNDEHDIYHVAVDYQIRTKR